MPLTALRRLADEATRLAARLATIEEANVLGPGNVNQEVDPLLVSEAEQPFGRNVVGPHRIDARREHGGEVIRNPTGFRKGISSQLRRKRPVSDAAHTQPLRTLGKLLAVHAHTV